jgi:hypothetical protein
MIVNLTCINHTPVYCEHKMWFQNEVWFRQVSESGEPGENYPTYCKKMITLSHKLVLSTTPHMWESNLGIDYISRTIIHTLPLNTLSVKYTSFALDLKQTRKACQRLAFSPVSKVRTNSLCKYIQSYKFFG